MANILMALPRRNFDPSEAAVTYKILTNLGHTVTFATQDGQVAIADDAMVTGRGLDIWGFIPRLDSITLVGRFLRADSRGRYAYNALISDPAFARPLRWDAIDSDRYDGVVFPGGHHAYGMREYLESDVLHRLAAVFFAADKPVGAICHGVVLLARSQGADGRSVLYGRRTTALPWAMERKAWNITRITRFWDANYYRTYLEEKGEAPGYRSVQQEVTRALARPEDFIDVPPDLPDAAMKNSGLKRDTPDDARPAWVVRDGNYVSGRWPGDVHTFAKTFAMLFDK